MRTTPRAVASIVSVLTALMLLVPSAASAADEIGLGRDGVTFAPALTAPLFAPEIRWVPGDVRTERFWVRNNMSTPAILEIDLRSDPVGELLASGDLLVTAVAPGGRAVTVTGNGQVLTDAPVAAATSIPVDVTVSFDAASTSRTENLSSQLVFGVRLTDSSDVGNSGGNNGNGSGTGSGGADNGGTNASSGNVLPGTGASVPLWLLVVAAAAAVAGALLVRRPRPSGVTHV